MKFSVFQMESSLLEICDIHLYASFTSTRGVTYAGPTFRCFAPNLPNNLHQDTHLRALPAELLTDTLTRYPQILSFCEETPLLRLVCVCVCLMSRFRTLFLDHLELHFSEVLSSAVAMVSERKEAVRLELELQLLQLNPEHIQTHICQPRLGSTHRHTHVLL